MKKSGNARKGRSEKAPAACRTDSDQIRKRTWGTKGQDLTSRILDLLNREIDSRRTFKEIVGFIQEITTFDAIGIRLQDGDDFPFFATTGFASTFVREESSLCRRTTGGNVVRGPSGKVSLECLCGKVIRGTGDSSPSCFTESGAFWTNSMSSVPVMASAEHLPLRQGFRCLSDGYESAALVPLRTGSRAVGILHLTDRRKNCVTPELLAFLEEVAACLGRVLTAVSSHEALRRANHDTEFRLKGMTAELAGSKARLEREVQARKAADLALQLARKNLEQQATDRTALQSRNEELLAELEQYRSGGDYVKASEEIFRTFYEQSPIGIHLFNAQGKLISANRTALEIFGISDFDEFRGFDLFSHGLLPDLVKDSLGMGETARFEIRFDFSSLKLFRTRKAGKIHLDVLINPSTGTFEGERISGYLVHVQDITERKQAEEALRLSESRFRDIYENSAVMMHSINQNGYLLNVNKKWMQELGYTREEVVGRRIDLVMAPESAREAFSTVLPTFWNEGKVSDVAYQYVKKDGTIIDVLLDSTVMKDPVWGLISLSVVRDVTDRKRAERALLQSEERFRAIFEGARDCIFIKDRSLSYTHVNPAMESLLGMQAKNLIGLKAENVYGEEAGKHIRDVDLRVLAGESIEEEHARSVNGSDLTFHDIRIPLRNSREEIIGICGISRNITERRKADPASRIIPVDYPSQAMKSALSKARYAAAADSIILLLGESGSGKDYLARWMHDHSRRAKGPFFAINCAAVPHELAESELFGHEAGAFTGARGRKRGLLELAEGGTLLLNEIGELSLPLQSKLLTFLDTRTFPRVGGEKSVRVNARLMAATHRDLHDEVAKGRFLQSLFYRLNVFSISVPPLRERIEDIPVLVKELMEKLAAEMQLMEIPQPDSSALDALSHYGWPGNVRELRNVLERALMLAHEGKIHLSLPQLSSLSEDWSCNVCFPENRSLHDLTGEITHLMCSEALRRSGGNKKKAARLLGISRDSLYRYMKSYGRGCDFLTPE
ncbi:MAG TPA: sigma 54-interacting transcriptional regulator [Desulfomonilaceae bacterium]|nr:sigma 54-interacting transcriptional regulator [Desulfomonilaceae bacterium]